MFKKFIFFVAVFIFFPLCITAQTQRLVPYDDPIYSFLDRAYTHGWINFLHQTRPYTEVEVYEYLQEIQAWHKKNPVKITPSILEKTEKYLDRMTGDKFHLLDSEIIKDGDGFIDFGNTTTINGAFNRLGDTTAITSIELNAGFNIKQNFYLGLGYDWMFGIIPWTLSPYRKFFEPNPYDWVFNTYNLEDGGATTGNNAIHQPGNIDFSIMGNSESQASFGTDFVTFHVGRGVQDWGPSGLSNFTLSKTAKNYEFVRMSLPLGPKGYFTWMTGFLQSSDAGRTEDYGKKLVTAHRVEYQFFKWFALAWTETVVYSNRFELGYINPFGLYYLSEMQLGDYDNKLAGFDFIFRIPPAPVKIYLSFLADDWRTEKIYSLRYYNNMYGIMGGVEVWDLLPRLDLNIEYTYMSHWMYTHRSDLSGADSYNNYVHDGTHLGHILEPNSHMLYFNAEYEIFPRFVAGLSFWFTQHGRGDIDTPPVWADELVLYGVEERTDLYYNFLDIGISDVPIETNLDWTLSGTYYIPRYGMKFGVSFSLNYTKNYDNVEGDNRLDFFFTLESTIFQY